MIIVQISKPHVITRVLQHSLPAARWSLNLLSQWQGQSILLKLIVNAFTHLTLRHTLNEIIIDSAFPAQHTSAPGLITVTTTALLFTPLMSLNPKLIIPLSDVRGVKKAGLLKGLYIRTVDTADDGQKQEKEEKFLWVGGRDELFARLVGAEPRRWMKV